MRICVFCGSSPGRGDLYLAAARELGRVLAERGIELVYGGARVGTMGELANAALTAGGRVIGVIPEHLMSREVGHDGLTELHVVRDMHERKATMAELSDGFIALPGGAGTLEELAEVWTWAQLALHAKPIGLLDVAGFYQPFRQFVLHMVTEEFLRPRHQEMLLIDESIERILDGFADYRPPAEKFSATDAGPAWPGSRTQS